MLKKALAVSCSFLLVALGSVPIAAPVEKAVKKAAPPRETRADKQLQSVKLSNVPHGSVSDPRSRAYALFYLQEKLSLTPKQIDSIDTVIQYGMDQRKSDKNINEAKLYNRQVKAIQGILGKKKSQKAIDILVERMLIGAAMPGSGFSAFRRYDLGKPGSPAKDTSQSEISDITAETPLEAPVAKIAPTQPKSQETPAEAVDPAKQAAD